MQPDLESKLLVNPLLVNPLPHMPFLALQIQQQIKI